MDTIEQGSQAAIAESAPAPEQQSPETQSTDVVEGESTKVEEPKPQNPRLQKRFDELTKARYEAERRAAELEARLAQQERQQTLKQHFTQLDAEKPRPEQFQTLAEYGDAVGSWATRKAVAEAHAAWEARQEQDAAEQAVRMQHHLAVHQEIARDNEVLTEKFASAAKKYPDFAQVVSNPELPSVRGTHAYKAMLLTENFGDISYFLAKNPAEYDRIFSIADPIRATREIAQLDAKFSGNGATSAPPPPPSRNGSSVVNKSTKDMTDAEWMAWREGELKKRSRR